MFLEAVGAAVRGEDGNCSRRCAAEGSLFRMASMLTDKRLFFLAGEASCDEDAERVMGERSRLTEGRRVLSCKSERRVLRAGGGPLAVSMP